LVKYEKELVSKLHEKEIEAGNVEHELARVKIDIMNTTIYCSQLKDRLQDDIDTLKSADKSIATIELEIKRNKDDIDRKMASVGCLNRKYEQMMQGVSEDEPIGPLEATIKKLEKEIEKFDQDAMKQKNDWVTQQENLINILETTDKLESENRLNSARLTVLEQKRMRLMQDINSNKATVKAIASSISSMHTDISRLNDLIGKYSQMKENLASENAVKQIEYDEDIRLLRDKVETLDMKIAKAVSEKEDHMMKIIASEKDLMQWEKKIQLEKETQKMLNSSEHANEIKGMEKEISRMKHRLEEINRQHEKMIREMEFTIHKREDIAVKNRNRKCNSNYIQPATIGETKKKKIDLHKKKMKMEQEKEMVRIYLQDQN